MDMEGKARARDKRTTRDGTTGAALRCGYGISLSISSVDYKRTFREREAPRWWPRRLHISNIESECYTRAIYMCVSDGVCMTDRDNASRTALRI